jgi:NADH-quinone oxidoreductase subunit C
MGWSADVLDLGRVIAGDRVSTSEEFDKLTMTVPSGWWRPIVLALRDRLGCDFFDWLSAVDEAGGATPYADEPELAGGFRVVCHLAALSPGVGRTAVRHVLVQTTVPRTEPVLDSLVGVYAGAAWHERETHEMFGIDFRDGVPLDTLLLPDAFEGHPLRKEFVLAARVVKPWPGAKEPGESDHDVAAAESSPGRRRMRPPGVPDAEQWGPREPGSPAPDPLAHATAGPAARPARPRRERKATPPPEGEGGDG